MGLAVARNVPPGTSLAGLTNLLRIIIRNRIYELEYLATFRRKSSEVEEHKHCC
jgi:hypothetical protein